MKKKLKLQDKIRSLPVGEIIAIDPAKYALMRYHARPVREVKTWLNQKTGLREVRLGDFIAGGRANKLQN